MASVSGITVEKASEIEDATVTGGHVTGGRLYLTTHGGTEIDAGVVVQPPPPLIDSWPVGSIYMSASSANPAVALGGGTWARWGQGRVPVSVDSNQAEFDGAEETGGEKTHTLTIAEMPNHAHGGYTGGETTNHQHAQAVNITMAFNVTHGGGNTGLDSGGSGQYTGLETQSHGHAVGAEGGGAAHNNLPPYITCYMWKRTA